MKARQARNLLVILLPLLLRALLSPFPHSGQGGYHGSSTAYGGDFEAQRHWMEITLHLPISQWYKYDASYWGLDYPPSIAYASYGMGWLSQKMVGVESVALVSSRGFEDETHKSFMRATVIAWDLIIYFPFVHLLSKRLGGQGPKRIAIFLTAVVQPALVLVDNGHFQYNQVCLGLSLGACHFMTLIDTIGVFDIIASVLFCLALNWKQMGLYYAPAVFSYLLGKCFHHRETWPKTLVNIAILGATVLGTFFFMFYPFYHFREQNESIFEVYGPILQRIFPFSRGLFEGKVANIWCLASTKPLSVRKHIPENLQPLCALLLTMLMLLPFCYNLFHAGRMGSKLAPHDKNSKGHTSPQHLKALLWGMSGTSLSFFLASFQVHEKSILLPLAPVSLLLFDSPDVIRWFSLVCVWSLWHLLTIDRLKVPYFATVVLFFCIFYCIDTSDIEYPLKFSMPRRSKKMTVEEITSMFIKIAIPRSIITMILLHIAEWLITPPKNLPDLFPVLWILKGCVSFIAMWCIGLMKTSTVIKKTRYFLKED